MRIDRDQFLWLALAMAAGCRGAVKHPPRTVVVPAPSGDSERSDRAPTGRISRLHARCDALPEVSEFSAYLCSGADTRQPLCHSVVDDHLPAVAEAVVECFARSDTTCAHCELVLCRWDAIERADKRRVAECDRIRSGKDGETWGDTCDAYASSLSPRALVRLAACLDGADPPGIECYTEPSLTPCWEGSGGPR
jgi:hypothetical protein